ncbi:heme-degrading domain-containing protein [Acidisoma cellulosilytica]|uniref:UPF0303 protein ACELLULO517_08145 n=1 Tax=Acidisoma cellulosilyticum TaxID=2802395 RepID=A0A964E3B6_9PROT|nr:heme-degrading domain-containing protein [Acidisoma cellulosilyticum]MCB8880199.1 heme-degrading domain-containing protein [Acidisoma cellulosilyticum]
MVTNAILASIARQEASLTFGKFTENTAWALGSLIRHRGEAEGWPIVVDIRLFHRQLFFAALPGSAPDNVEWARRKRNVVERFHRSSYAVGREMVAKKDTLANRYGLSLAEYADHGGGFPITLQGTGVIGAIVVSGLPQRDDHMLIVDTLCEMLGQDPAELRLADD